MLRNHPKVSAVQTSRPSSSSFWKQQWNADNKLLETRPILTKVVTASGIAAVGDVSCQLVLESGDQPFDWKRMAIFTFLGGALVAPVLHGWYNVLGARLPGVANSVRLF